MRIYYCIFIFILLLICNISCTNKQQETNNIEEEKSAEIENPKIDSTLTELAELLDTIPVPVKKLKKRKAKIEEDIVEIAELQNVERIKIDDQTLIGCNPSSDNLPQFPGGEKERINFLNANLRYPIQTAENQLEGRVVVRFVVAKDGNITDVEILKGLDSFSDQEAIRLVKSMPKWVPARVNGRPVTFSFILPIMFKLQKFSY